MATTLRPYIKAALSFIALHRNDPYIASALAELRDLISNAPPTEIVTRLRGKPPQERARQVFSRLLDRGMKPERLLAIAVAVHALIEEAPAICHRIEEWRIVAIAKAAHRLAGGYHKVWEMTDANGRTHRTELHAYARASGRVLHFLGTAIEKSCELVLDRHLPAVLALKITRHGPHPAIADPLRFAAAATAPPSAETF